MLAGEWYLDVPCFPVHGVDQLITALPLIPDLEGLFFSEWRMDKEAYTATGFEHGTVAGVLWQKGALGLAARSQANSGPERVGEEPYFHLRSIAPSTMFRGLRSDCRGESYCGVAIGSCSRICTESRSFSRQ